MPDTFETEPKPGTAAAPTNAHTEAEDLRSERQPRASWKRRILDGSVRWIVRLLLIAILLTEILYLARGPLWEHFGRDRVAQLIAETTGAESVSLGALEGNLFTQAALNDVKLLGAEGDFIRNVDNLSVRLRLDPLALARGDHAGLVQAALHADRIELNLNGRLPSADPNHATHDRPHRTNGPFPVLGMAARGCRAHRR